jgi:hypothetical protein
MGLRIWDALAVSDTAAFLQFLDVIVFRRLNPQFGTQQMARVMHLIENNCPIAGRLGFAQSPEATLAGGKVVPEHRISRRRPDYPSVQRVGAIVPSEPHRYVGKTVVRVSDSLLIFERLQDNPLSVGRSPQLQQYCCEHAVCRKADTLSHHRSLGKYQGICDATGAHQSVCLDIGKG